MTKQASKKKYGKKCKNNSTVKDTKLRMVSYKMPLSSKQTSDAKDTTKKKKQEKKEKK